jgi:predicted cobalt transporter CbtA
MVRKLLLLGMLSGLAAGLLAFGAARVIGEPQVDAAIAFESHLEHELHHDAPAQQAVSRSLQSSAGLGTGALVAGVALGGIFALVFAVAYGRLGTSTARGTAAVLALLAFVAIVLVPGLKYPANPPSIGMQDTIGRRTTLYLIALAVSVLVMVLAIVARRHYETRLGAWNATILGGVGYVVVVGTALVVLPGVNEVPQQAIPGVVDAVTDAGVTFPPVVLWKFRVASYATQALLWTTIGLVFGWLAGRELEPSAPSADTAHADRGHR